MVLDSILVLTRQDTYGGGHPLFNRRLAPRLRPLSCCSPSDSRSACSDHCINQPCAPMLSPCLVGYWQGAICIRKKGKGRERRANTSAIRLARRSRPPEQEPIQFPRARLSAGIEASHRPGGLSVRLLALIWAEPSNRPHRQQKQTSRGSIPSLKPWRDP
jgi:hypothetical protein